MRVSGYRRFNASGWPYVEPPVGVWTAKGKAKGVIPWILPRLEDAVLISDPNAILVSPITQAADGEFTAILKASPGAIDFSDPGDGAFIAWPAKDIFGCDVVGSTQEQPMYAVKAFDGSVIFGNTDDAWVACGISDLADLNAAATGLGHGMKYAAATRYVRRIQLAAGVDSTTDSAALAAMRGYRGTAYALGGGLGLTAGHSTAVDAAGAYLGLVVGSGGVVSTGSTSMHFWLCFHRTANTATQVTGAFTPRYYVVPLMGVGNSE